MAARPTYASIIDLIRPHAIDRRVFVASDEQPFVDAVKAEFGDVFTYEEAYRSSFNSSGLDIGNTLNCRSGNDSEPCRKLNEIIHKHTVHRSSNVSPFKKGEDAVIDMWLLSRCDVFVRSSGNFSSQPKRINPNLKVVHQVEAQ